MVQKSMRHLLSEVKCKDVPESKRWTKGNSVVGFVSATAACTCMKVS